MDPTFLLAPPGRSPQQTVAFAACVSPWSKKGQTLMKRSKPDLRKQSGDAGAAALTHRERQILRLVSEGLSNKEIGRRLKVTDGTIKVHLHNIFEKLVVGNQTALAALCLNHDSEK